MLPVMTKYLLIVAHAPSPNTHSLCQAVLRGAMNLSIDGIRVRHIPPLQATVQDVHAANALILGTTENFGYMSGALKDFFDRIFYPCLEHTQGMPYACYIRAGKDGTGTQRAIESITQGLSWRLVQAPLILQGEFQEAFNIQCEELGAAMAAGLEAGIF